MIDITEKDQLDSIEAEIRKDERQKVCSNIIESIEEDKRWYIEAYKETDKNNVSIHTILYDMNVLIKKVHELAELTK